MKSAWSLFGSALIMRPTNWNYLLAIDNPCCGFRHMFQIYYRSTNPFAGSNNVQSITYNDSELIWKPFISSTLDATPNLRAHSINMPAWIFQRLIVFDINRAWVLTQHTGRKTGYVLIYLPQNHMHRFGWIKSTTGEVVLVREFAKPTSSSFSFPVPKLFKLPPPPPSPNSLFNPVVFNAI